MMIYLPRHQRMLNTEHITGARLLDGSNTLEIHLSDGDLICLHCTEEKEARSLISGIQNIHNAVHFDDEQERNVN